jgi:hypothetical protein
MNRRSDAREKQSYSIKRPVQFRRRRSSVFFRIPLENFYSLERSKIFAACKNSIPRFQFDVVFKSFIPFPRNIPNRQFVYTGAAGCRAVQGEIQKKPRGGSRGVMTRSLSGR